MNSKVKSLLTLALGSVLLTACGGGSGSTDNSDNEPPIVDNTQANNPVSANSVLGQVFVSEQNLTLYTFEDDRTDAQGDGLGDSDCNGACASNWPPLEASANATASSPFSIITRDDGTTRQWALHGLPLYRFAGDANSGEVNGESIGGTWFVARPPSWRSGEVNAQANGTVFVGQFTVRGTDGSGGIGAERIEKDGLTLYTFENDRNDTDGDGAGDSDCNTTCAETWPPLFADSGATDVGLFTVIDRDDGTRQWAYSGLPLYFFVGDAQAGDTEGEGLGDVWFVARPNPVALASSQLGSILKSTTSAANVDETGAKESQSRSRSDFALYVFDNDKLDIDGDGLGDSDCNGSCAVTWPPLFADAGATPQGNYSIITRDDGSLQWAFKGEPLYFFASDSSSDDVNGDKVGDVWHVARTTSLQLFDAQNDINVFAARGLINDVDQNGNRASTQSDKTGFTVYLFDEDANDAEGDGADDSDCNGGCAVTWPPLYANENDVAHGDFSIITRDDNSLQWAYKGAPLYFFQGDSAPEQTTGVYTTWRLVSL